MPLRSCDSYGSEAHTRGRNRVNALERVQERATYAEACFGQAWPQGRSAEPITYDYMDKAEKKHEVIEEGRQALTEANHWAAVAQAEATQKLALAMERQAAAMERIADLIEGAENFFLKRGNP